MAAPSNAYRNKSLWMRGGTTNYEHKVAILQEDKATMLERFYLDDLVAVKVDGTNDGVIGAVIIGGDNEKMHNITTRGGVGRVRVQGQTARLLNDAGLNTKGNATIEDIIVQWGNLVALQIKYDSAYYLSSSNLGLRWRVGGGAWSDVTLHTYLAQNSTLSLVGEFNPDLEIGQSVELQLVHTNPEGTYYSPSVNVVAGERVQSFDAIRRNSPCSETGQTYETLWMFEDQVALLPTVTTEAAVTGIYVYTDYTMTTVMPSGWYLGFADDKVFFVDTNGQITHYTICAPSIPTLYVAAEYQGADPELQSGKYVVVAYLSDVYTSNIVVNGRIDKTEVAGPSAKYFTLTINAGTISAYSLPYDLSDGVYYFFDVSSNIIGQTIQVQPGSIN